MAATAQRFAKVVLTPQQVRERELHALTKDALIKIVLELEAKNDALEGDNALCRDMVSDDGRAAALHERLVEMDFASGPLHVQSADYCAKLTRAIRRA